MLKGQASVPALGSRPLWTTVYQRPFVVLLAVVLWHLSAWVLAPMLSYRMLPLDTLELLGWGQEWQLGYYKHPPLGPWLGEAFLQLFGGRLESLYLLAQLCVVVTLIYVWKTARLLLDPRAAILATVLLEGAYWYTYLSPNFNMNLLQLPTWAGLCYHFLRGLRGDSRQWIYWGVFVGLCLLSKYSGLLLVASCAGVLLSSPSGRRALGQPGPYLGAGLALLILAPHALWLSEHWQLPWSYLRGFDPDTRLGWSAHLLEPLRFALGALLGLLFSAALFLSLVDRGAARPRLREEQWIVLALCLTPLLLAMLYGLVSGSRLKSTWAFPFFNLAGIALFMLLPIRIDPVRFRRFCLGLIAIALFSLAAHLGYKSFSDRSKTQFAGADLTQAVSTAWDQRFATPLKLVAGNHVLAAIVSSYAASRPSMLINGDFAISLWTSRAQLEREGAVLVCALNAPCFPELDQLISERSELDAGGQRFQMHFIAPQGSRKVGGTSAEGETN